MSEMRKLMESLSAIDAPVQEPVQEDFVGREITNQVHDLMDEGVLDPRVVADAALKYMSENDVRDMAQANEFFPPEYEDEEHEW